MASNTPDSGPNRSCKHVVPATERARRHMMAAFDTLPTEVRQRLSIAPHPFCPKCMHRSGASLGVAGVLDRWDAAITRHYADVGQPVPARP